MKPSVVVVLFGLLAAQSPTFYRPFVPNVRDLTIRLRYTTEAGAVVESDSSSTLYFKAARQRDEFAIERGFVLGRRRHGMVITQCDQQRTINLHDEARTYAYQPIYAPSDYFSRARQPPSPETPITLTITTNSVDTGERRRIGSYVARHVVTTIHMEFRRDGQTRVEYRDGWYIDLPVGCRDWARRFELYDTTSVNPGTRVIRHGNGRRGFPIVETVRSPHGRRVWREGVTTTVVLTSKTELVHLSEEELDPALFVVPPGYRPALRRPRGGHDMRKPDTFGNRAELYGQELVAWLSRVFR